MQIDKTINGFLNEFTYHNKIAKSIGKPTIFAIETTNKCNLACRMCPRQFMKRKVGTMSMKLFKKIIDEARDYQDFIILHGMGEPLLDDHIIERINYAEDSGIRVNISTNGAFLNETSSRKILGSKLSEIILSVDATTVEVYSRIRTNGDFEKVKANFHRFMQIKNKEFPKSRLKTMVQFIKMDDNIHEIENFRKEWLLENPSEIRIKPFGTFSGQHEQIARLAAMEHRYQPKKVKTKPPCYYLWKSVLVQWDGEVVPCCRDYDSKIVLGDLNKQTLLEVWHGGGMIKLREDHLRGRFKNGLCNNCTDTSTIWPKTFYPFNFEMLKQIKKRIIG